jgi:hypothetical protein
MPSWTPNFAAMSALVNYLASGASGSLRDCYFHPMNGDRVTEGSCAAANEQYQSLVDKATRLSLRLPAPADWTE